MNPRRAPTTPQTSRPRRHLEPQGTPIGSDRGLDFLKKEREVTRVLKGHSPPVGYLEFHGETQRPDIPGARSSQIRDEDPKVVTLDHDGTPKHF
jgi:hypothetical protein